MALLDEMKIALRVSGTDFDSEVSGLIAEAKQHLVSRGIEESYVDADDTPAPVERAVRCYVKAMFGFDNDDKDFFLKQFEQAEIDLLNSSANPALKDAE